MMKKSSLLTFSFLPILLGMFLISNDDFLNVYGMVKNSGMNWIDDSIFGVVLVFIGILLLWSTRKKNMKLQCFGFVMLGASLFSISTIYFYRHTLGFPNITWIFSTALFILIYTSINKAGED